MPLLQTISGHGILLLWMTAAKLEKIMKVHPYSAMLSGASHAIVVCGDETLQNGPDVLSARLFGRHPEYSSGSSHSMGYGAVWLGVEPRDERIKGNQ